MLALLATRKGRSGALFCLPLASGAHGQSSWDELRRSALAAPDAAEKMGDAITRRMREDWPGFLALLARHPRDDAFFEVVLRSRCAAGAVRCHRQGSRGGAKECPVGY